jgi:hypothetical protein
MSEFVFRNLSEGGEECGLGRQPQSLMACDPCTLGDPCTYSCTQTPTCDRCSGVPFSGAMCLPGTGDPFCGNVTAVHANPRLWWRTGDPRAELGVLKARLRQEFAAVEADEQRLAASAKPRSVEEVDALKVQLLAAVEELDQQRAEMEGGGPTS